MNYLEIFAIKVEQPLCNFYLTSIKAKNIQEFAFSEQLQYIDETGKLSGSQRKVDNKRLEEIGKYIDSVEMSFPNTIILAVNYNQKGELVNDANVRWDVEQVDGSLYKILIPSDIKLAAVIDGQHRLKGFEDEYISNKARVDVDLPCAIFFDLPNSYQAFLFATINGNQKKVDKSLALEQFGFNVEDEPQQSWTPEKLAVFFTRKLNFKSSPLSGHIKIAPKISTHLAEQVFGIQREWTISTATIVDGILNLISSKPKRDRVEMAQENIWGKRTRGMVEKFKRDSSPLRQFYLKNDDETIFKVITNFLTAANETVWKNYNAHSYIFKTVGVQALFDVLKSILLHENSSEPESIDFKKYLSPLVKVDFSDKFFQASGIGRSRIKNTIKIDSGLLQKDKVKKNDVSFYENLLTGNSTNMGKDKAVWDDEAENAVINCLEKAEWNYKAQSVNLYLNGDYDTAILVENYNEFFAKLMEIAELNFTLHLPDDIEFADQQKENFDAADLVKSCLVEYDINLKELNWI